MSYLLADLDARVCVLVDPRVADLLALHVTLDEHRLRRCGLLRRLLPNARLAQQLRQGLSAVLTADNAFADPGGLPTAARVLRERRRSRGSG